MGRILVCGDIHGGYKSLLQVLERAEVTPEDKLIFLGDYVDGWPETYEVVEELIEIKKRYDCIFLMGNHDKWFDNYLRYNQILPIWINQGGQATLDSYKDKIIPEEHYDFFRHLHNYYVDDQNRGFVHGGFVSKKGLGHDTHQSSYYWDRDMWELAVANHTNYISDQLKDEDYDFYYRPNPNRFMKHKEIFIGHTSTVMFKVKPHLPEYKFEEQPKSGSIIVPMNRCNVWNLDTGGGWNGKLTIMDIDTKEFWQSDFIKDLYPNSKGR